MLIECTLTAGCAMGAVTAYPFTQKRPRVAIMQNKLLAQWVKMAARKWTTAQKARQAEVIRTWQPWQHSTGARTSSGKAIISRNAYRGGTWQLIRFSRWVSWAINHPDTLTPEIVETAKQQYLKLSGDWRGWLSEAEAKITEKC